MLNTGRAWRATLVVLAAALLGACGTPEQERAADPRGTTPESASPTHSSFPATEPISLAVGMEAGSLRIQAGRHDKAEVAIQPTNAVDPRDVETATNTSVRFDAGALTVETPQRPASWDEPGSIDVRVVLPEGSNAKVGVSTADVETTGRLGRAELESSTGALTLDQAADVSIGTAGGKVRCREVTGDAVLESAGGDLELLKVGGRSELSNTSGAIHVGQAAGPVELTTTGGGAVVDQAANSVHVQATAGTVRLGSVRRGQILVEGTGPTVHVGVAAGVSAWLDLDSLGGAVRSTIDPVPEAEAAVKVRVNLTGGDIDVARSR